MAFHFPLMPRLFMALRLETGNPSWTSWPHAGNSGQLPVGLFLRNHDELTLEWSATASATTCT